VSSRQVESKALAFEVENVGGIDEASVQFQPGVTLLKGRNATNRTSLLRSIMTAMGSNRYNLKSDADHGRVRLSLNGTVVERTFKRTNGTVQAEGDTYLDDPELADIFAFLLQDNEARRAVIQGDNLRELITRPIDTESINKEIEQTQEKRQQLDERIETIEQRESELPQLERRKNKLESSIEEKQDRLEELEAKIETADADIDETRKRKAETEEQLDELKEMRSELDDIRFQIETTRETVESLEQEQSEKRNELERLPTDSASDVEELRSRLDDLRKKKRSIDADITELQNVIEFNETMLEGTRREIVTALRDDEQGTEAVTEKLLEDDRQVICWTCGSSVDRAEIEKTLKRLQSLRADKMSRQSSLQEEIETTEREMSGIESNQGKVRRLKERLSEIDAEIERKKERVSELEGRKDSLQSATEDLESAIEDQDASDYSDLLDLHKQANKVEIEIEQKENELAATVKEISDVESLAQERDEHKRRREELSERLSELRNRITNLETEATEAFNRHMEEILEVLGYDNIERVWIERVERTIREGRQKVKKGKFELHIVRESESGRTYEGTIETLSESEREVTGLVFALAGYLIHDLHESVPVMLLDSLEAIDATRLNRLIGYFADYSKFLIVAVLPEDAEAVEVPHDTITELN